MHTLAVETPPLGKHVYSTQMNHVKETKTVTMKNTYKRVCYLLFAFKKSLFVVAHSGNKCPVCR